MNKSVKISVAFISLYACLLSVLHGLFETLQGSNRTDGIFINAIYRIGQNGEMWHGNFPAITIIPNYFFAGIITIILSLVLITYIIYNYRTRFCLYVLFILPFLIFISGGGFFPFFLLIISGISSISINHKFKMTKSKKINSVVSIIWVMCISLFIVSIIAECVLGSLYNDEIVKISPILFATKIVLPVLIIIMGIINDVRRRSA